MDLWREIVGWAGSALLIVSLLQPTISRLRWLNLGASSLLMGYNLMLGSAPMVALNITLIAINCWYLFVYTRSARAARLRVATVDGLSEASDRQTSR
ncbi:hypothetical protein [Microbacterium aurugineum]